MSEKNLSNHAARATIKAAKMGWPGVRWCEARVLEFLLTTGQATVQQIKEHLGSSNGWAWTVTQILKRLGLVAEQAKLKLPGKGDNPRILVLTEEARKIRLGSDYGRVKSRLKEPNLRTHKVAQLHP